MVQRTNLVRFSSLGRNIPYITDNSLRTVVFPSLSSLCLRLLTSQCKTIFIHP